ncbi:MAG: cation:proton antiporter [Anaerolineales bacterium]|jgi:Kef-type K+ transport system membrane component KefB/nucleotide-binding universal stress UspA family protein
MHTQILSAPAPLLTEPVSIFLTLIAVILITPILSERARLPGIVGLMVGGILVGPHGFNLLSTGRTIELLSTVGLIYLMFSAGLEIDLNQFNQVRNKSMLFGALTFIIPEVSGIGLGRLFGLDWSGSVLLGSVYASHTLVAFPILSRLGILRNESVSVTVGATVFTDVLALLILAVVAGAHGGPHAAAEGEELSLATLIQLIMLMTGYAFIILFGLPRVGKLFFRHFTGRSVEFQFVLVSLFVAAFLADLIGMHAIVGAFLAGLAINSTLPPRSSVAGQVLFLGESFFIPIFLMYIGMMLDPAAILSNLGTILVGLALTLAVYATKYIAAWITSRINGYSRDERMTMWGLSQAQAAATLATVMVGVNVGLFPQTVFNAAILMVLFTVISSSLITQRFGERLRPQAVSIVSQPLFNRILVPIANPQNHVHLITLAAILARWGKGVLYPVNIAQEVHGRVEGRDHQRQLLDDPILKDPQTDIYPIGRVDTSVPRGILRTAIENDASLIVMGWHGQASSVREAVFGSVQDEVMWSAQVPVVVGRLTTPINAVERVVLIVPHHSLELKSVARTLEMVTAISQAVNVPLKVLAAGEYMEALQDCLRLLADGHPYDFSPLANNVLRDVGAKVNGHDLIAVTTVGSSSRFRSGLGELPEHIAAIRESSIMVIRYP